MRLQCLVTILACSVSIACIAASEPAPLAYSPLAQTPSSNAVASAAPEATKAGMAIMEQGGNAFDAAVAVAGALAVVEPYYSGLGGGGFWLMHLGYSETDLFLDSREVAPARATANMFLNQQGDVIKNLSVTGPLAAAIPGEPAGMAYVANNFGRLTLARDLAPAITLAKQGFPVNQRYRDMAEMRLDDLRRSPAAAKVFLKDNEVPPVGYIVKQPDLANTLTTFAQQGKAGFYDGLVAKQLVQGVKHAGGIWEANDLTNYHVLLRRPLTANYHNMSIVTAPPPSAGGIGLITMLNILEKFDMTELTPMQQIQLTVEAMRRAYFDRTRYLADPNYVTVPTRRLTSMQHADRLRETITPRKATPSKSLGKPEIKITEGQHTTHFSIIDKEGNRAAVTLSLNYPFGACFMPPGTGVILNDEMDDFSTKPGAPNVYGIVGSHANEIAPGKRPLSSMTPTFITTQTGVGIIGTPGGSRITTMVLLGILDFEKGHLPDSWVKVSRYHHQYLPDEIQYEPGTFTDEQIKQLEAMGYKLHEINRHFGNMQAIYWDRATNTVYSASDPRGGLVY